jgi:hypothetical protein
MKLYILILVWAQFLSFDYFFVFFCLFASYWIYDGLHWWIRLRSRSLFLFMVALFIFLLCFPQLTPFYVFVLYLCIYHMLQY